MENDCEKGKFKKLFKNEEPFVSYEKKCFGSSNSFITLEQQQAWEKHSKYLANFIKNDGDPRDWSEDEVVEFVSSLPTLRDHTSVFSEHNIDGESLLMLSQQDIIDILKVKVGPAIKLYNSIVLLRHNVVNYYA